LRYWESRNVVTAVRVEHGQRSWRAYTAEMADKIRRLAWLLSIGMTLRSAVEKLPEVARLEAERGAPMGQPRPADPKQGTVGVPASSGQS
jgi:DNA-binding transcriptional MerR regulator